jgi:hypothetical protein
MTLKGTAALLLILAFAAILVLTACLCLRMWRDDRRLRKEREQLPGPDWSAWNEYEAPTVTRLQANQMYLSRTRRGAL